MNVTRLHPDAPPLLRTRLSPDDAAIYFPVAERQLYYQDEHGSLFGSPDHKQLIRDDYAIPVPLAVVGNGYKLVQNRELYEAIEADIIAKIPSNKLEHVEVRDKMSFGGAMCMRAYIFHNITRDIVTPKGFEDTHVGFRAIVINGFGASAIKIILGAIDFFCLNGIVIGVSDRKVRKHTSGLDVTRLSNYIAGNLQLFEQSADQWCEWAKRGITDDQALKFFNDLVEHDYLSTRIARRLYNRYAREEKSTRGGTLWALVSALTYYSTHNDEDAGFGIRKTDKDHEAATLIKRSEDVRNIIRSNVFARLAA